LKPRRGNFHSESSKPQCASAGERYEILIAEIHNKEVRFESLTTVTQDFLLLKGNVEHSVKNLQTYFYLHCFIVPSLKKFILVRDTDLSLQNKDEMKGYI